MYFALKFEEGFSECSNHLPKALLEKCRSYYDTHLDLLVSVDGPCIIHRDFRPGNIMVCDGKLQGIIDWASGRAGFAEEDFCPLEHGEWSVNPTIRKSFLAGYAKVFDRSRTTATKCSCYVLVERLVQLALPLSMERGTQLIRASIRSDELPAS